MGLRERNDIFGIEKIPLIDHEQRIRLDTRENFLKIYLRDAMLCGRETRTVGTIEKRKLLKCDGTVSIATRDFAVCQSNE